MSAPGRLAFAGAVASRRRSVPGSIGIVLGVLAFTGCSDDAAVAPPPSAIAIRDVRVFDGTSVLERATVVIKGDRIVEVGAAPAIPADAEVVDGVGKTLLPGLIDAHAHVWHAGHLKQSAMLGVTTVLDMGCGDPNWGRALRLGAADRASPAADIRFAGFAVTAPPDGHCTEYGFPVPTITSASEAQAFVDARIAEGSDYIKIIYDDGHQFGKSYATISRETLTAAIEAAHARGKSWRAPMRPTPELPTAPAFTASSNCWSRPGSPPPRPSSRPRQRPRRASASMIAVAWRPACAPTWCSCTETPPPTST